MADDSLESLTKANEWIDLMAKSIQSTKEAIEVAKTAYVTPVANPLAPFKSDAEATAKAAIGAAKRAAETAREAADRAAVQLGIALNRGNDRWRRARESALISGLWA